jgi:type IV secretion system protein VirD4
MLMIAPVIVMGMTALLLRGSENWLSPLGTTPDARVLLGRAGIALPYLAAAVAGVTFLFAAAGALSIRFAGVGVAIGAIGLAVLAVAIEAMRLSGFADRVPSGELLNYADMAVAIGAASLFGVSMFGLRVALRGNAAFARNDPRRIRGQRAIHGNAEWMSMQRAAKLFPAAGGIPVGEAYRVDRDTVAHVSFVPSDKETWGKGGKASLLCFDAGFGSTHGLVFAGSGGFKTVSVAVPAALKWGGALVVLDPSNEIAPMVMEHRRRANRKVIVLDPATSHIGFNVLDWVGRFGSTKEEDIAAVATWVMTDSARMGNLRDDFFRGTSLQLVTALIADVCLSGNTPPEKQSLRQVRQNLAEPEPRLRARLQEIWDNSKSRFVRENVAPFINMTPETFSGVYASAAKETHWLSYENFAELVSGESFVSDEIAKGKTDVFLSLDLKTLETHPALARVIIGALMNAIYNRDGDIDGRALFVLDEAARLGYMRIVEIARDAGRKYGITLLMLFQSVGQLRDAYGGRDAASKWFESASWVSFAAVNDAETAEFISRRCGETTVEVDQVSRTSRMGGSSRTRSKSLASRRLILPHEVLQMRADEQVIFTAGNPPLRCGRAIYFRRDDMLACVAANRFARPRSARAARMEPARPVPVDSDTTPDRQEPGE